MKKLTISKNENPSHSDGRSVNIRSAIETAETASLYASQLREEYLSKLHKAIALTDVKVAGRFFSLTQELVFMSDMTVNNLKRGEK